jgi:dihydrofolate reductase
MAKLLVQNSITLDGVMQSPARPDEDTEGGFEHGGWAIPYADDVAAREMGKLMSRPQEPGALLLGRRTYEDFYEVWPKRAADGNPYTEVLNRTQKYVVSRTLEGPLPWQNSTLVKGEAATTVAALKAQVEGTLRVLGSQRLLQTLISEDLVDEYLLLITPLVLGSGRRQFPEAGVRSRFELVQSVTTTTGVIIASYRRLEEP